MPQGADEISFGAFYADQYPAVVRVAYVLTGRRPIAEEIAQDAFVAAYRNWDRISHYDRPEAWVRRVATNRCISSGRRAFTEARLLVRLRRQRPAEPQLEARDDALWAEVRRLPRRQAQVVALAYIEDRSVDDIAEILSCGAETVRTHLRRARATLAERLELTPAEEPTVEEGVDPGQTEGRAHTTKAEHDHD